MTKKIEPSPAFTPLAVVGMGGVFPKAKTIRQFWANIKNKVDAIQEVPASHWSKDDYFDADQKKQDKVYAYKGGFLESYDFDPSEFGLAPNTLEATDPAQLLAQLVVLGVVGQRDIGEKTAGFILQGPEHGEMLDPVGGGLHMSVEHGAVGRDSEPMGDPMNLEPLRSGQLPLGDGGPDRRAEHLGPAAGKAGQPGLLERQQDLGHRALLDPRQVGDLDRGERLDVHLGESLPEAPDHVGVVGEPELRVQAAHDVKLPGRPAPGLLRLLIDLFERSGVGPLLLGHPGERAKHAGVPQDADIGGIEVLIGREEHPVPVLPLVGERGELSQAEDVAGLVQRDPLGRVEPLSCQNPLGDGSQGRIAKPGWIRDGQFYLRAGTGFTRRLNLVEQGYGCDLLLGTKRGHTGD